MLVPYLWLKDYLPDLEATAEEIAEKMTMAGVEVESVEDFNPGIQGLFAGIVQGIEKHPEREDISVVSVDTGDTALRQVICGASNVEVGQIVPVVIPGSVLPGNKKITELEFDGVTSHGMICSATELGLELVQEEEGIMVLREDIKPGTDLVKHWGIDDKIIELSLTPNRADCLGLVGVANELAAIFELEVQPPSEIPPETAEETNKYTSVQIRDEDLCRRYTARVIRGVKVRNAPVWMQMRLLKAGIRPINSIVDITNYVMWEYGQPLHAFDYKLINDGSIIVRRAQEGEKLTTIDDVERRLTPDNLVIADPNSPIALAGVMGGKNTEISENTDEVLLESAFFDPVSIRRTARSTALISEASQRFEKGVAPEGVLSAQNRASRLMAELEGGEVLKGVVDNYPRPVHPVEIEITPQKVKNILGIEIPAAEILSILQKLGFGVEAEKDQGAIKVTVPTRRADVHIEEDVVEEVARLYGYDNIPAVLPGGSLIPSREPDHKRAFEAMRNFMLSSGFYEIITYSFINHRLLDKLRLSEDDPLRKWVPVQNPISEEQGIMRTTLIPGILEVIKYNFHYRMNSQLLFELGSAFLPRQIPVEELPEEKQVLSMAGTGKIPTVSWNIPAQEVDFFYLKGALEGMVEDLTEENLSFVKTEKPFLHPYQCAAVYLGDKEIGYMGTLHPEVAKDYGFKQKVVLAEIDMEEVINKARLFKEFRPLPKYPASLRDLAVIVPEEVTSRQVENCIRQAGSDLVESIYLFDVYSGKPIPLGYRSLAFSIVYRSLKKTLTDEEVNEVHQAIEEELYNQLGVTLRKQ